MNTEKREKSKKSRTEEPGAAPRASFFSPGLQGSQAGEAGAAPQPSRSAPKVKKLKLEEDSHE